MGRSMAQRHSSTDWGPQRLPEGLCWLWSTCCVEPLSPTLGEDGLVSRPGGRASGFFPRSEAHGVLGRYQRDPKVRDSLPFKQAQL